MPADDIYELSVDHTLAGQNLTNVYHFQQIGSDGTDDARWALKDIWNDTFLSKWLDCLTDQVDVVQARVRRISPTKTQTYTSAMVGAGYATTESLPTQSCAILRTYATPDGRKGTGYVKLSGCSVFFVQKGRINLTLIGLLEIFGALMEIDHTDSGSGYVFHQVVWSHVDTVARQILQARALGVIKTVHSRQLGVGD